MSELPQLPEGATLDGLPPLPPGASLDGGEAADDSWKPSGRDTIKDRLKLMGGVAEIAGKGMIAGVAEITSGYAGLMALAMSKGDSDYAKKRVESWQDFVSIDSTGDGAGWLMNQVAPEMSAASLGVKDFSEEVTDGDPLAAAMVEATIWASVDIAAAAVPGAKYLINNSKIIKMRKQVIAEANRLGIDIHLDHFADDVAAAAKMVGSESAGEAAMEYVTALRNAEYRAKLKKNSLYAAAIDEKLFVSTSPVRKMGAELARELDGPFDLDGPKMLEVRRTLDDMHSYKLGFGSGQGLAVHFNKFETLRKRINGRIRTSRTVELGKQKAALIKIRSRIDDFMTSEFNKAAIENGKVISNGGALSGDAEGFLTYLSARKAAHEHAWFKENKVIADLISKDASVDQVAQWLIGASAISKRGAASVVNQMKRVLGEDSPAIEAVRADFIYQITEPLLQAEPNLKQFANNFDKVLRKNKPMVDALGLQESDVAALAAFAETAHQLPPGGKFYTPRELIQTVSRLTVGHGVAKGAARVQFMTKVLNMMGAVDKVSAAQILDGIVDARFDQPMFPKGKPVTAALTAGAALSDISEEANN